MDFAKQVTESVTKQIADRLKIAREDADLTPEAASAKTYGTVSTSYIYRLEKADSMPSVTRLVLLLDAYGVSPSQFFSSFRIRKTWRQKGEESNGNGKDRIAERNRVSRN